MPSRVECAGRSDRPLESPYEALFWFEGQRAGCSPSGSWWAREGTGIGVVASPSLRGPEAERAAAAAVDAFRRGIADPLPRPAGMARSPADVERSLRQGIAAANEAIAARSAATAGRQASCPCSLAAAAVVDRHVVVARVGGCAVYVFRDGVCHAADALSTGPEPPENPTMLLGEQERIRPRLRTVEGRPEDVIVLVSEGVASSLDGAEEIGDLLCQATTLEGACERVLLEARLRGSSGCNCVVLMGIDLSPTGRFFVDPARDPLPFALAVRMVGLPGPLAEKGLRARRMLGLSGTTETGPEYLALLAPPDEDAPPPATLPPAHVEEVGPEPPIEEPKAASPTPPWAPRRRGRWRAIAGLCALAATVIIAVIVVVVGGSSSPGVATSKSSSAARPPLLDPPGRGVAAEHVRRVSDLRPAMPSSTASARERTQYEALVSPALGRVAVSLDAQSPSPVEAIIQVARRHGWTVLRRCTIAPGETVWTSLPFGLSAATPFTGRDVTLQFRSDARGQAVWASTMSLAGLPPNTSLSAAAHRINAADRATGVLVSLEPIVEPLGLPGRGAERAEW